ncbi:MAG: hypothetical protein ACI9NQ_001520 [Paracoccaceae bacterium]|jgi:hypothetical protein
MLGGGNLTTEEAEAWLLWSWRLGEMMVYGKVFEGCWVFLVLAVAIRRSRFLS